MSLRIATKSTAVIVNCIDMGGENIDIYSLSDVWWRNIDVSSLSDVQETLCRLINASWAPGEIKRWISMENYCALFRINSTQSA